MHNPNMELDGRPLAMLLCLVVLSSFKPQASGEQAAPAIHKAGNNPFLQWRLPGNITGSIINISLKTLNKTQNIFFADLENGTVIKNNQVAPRLEVLASGLLASPRVVAFTLNSVSVTDAGQYFCIQGFAELPVIVSCGQLLVIVDMPINARIVAESKAVENRDLNLECTATSTSQPPNHGLPLQVQWFDSQGRTLSEGGGEGKVVMEGHRLVVRAVQRQDKGLQLSCHAQDGLDLWSQKSAPYMLQPEYGPKEDDIILSNISVSIVERSAVQQLCAAVCHPDCVVSWEKQHIQGNWYNITSLSGLLNIASVQRSDGGKYQCRAANMHGFATQPFTIDVKYSPILKETLVDRIVASKAHRDEHSNVTLQCIFDSNPAPEVTWQGPDHLFVENLEGRMPHVPKDSLIQQMLYTSESVIRNLKCSDSGSYVCSGKNSLGAWPGRQIDLDVRCKPRSAYGDQALKQLYLFSADEAISIKFQMEALPPAEIKMIVSEDEDGHRRVEESSKAWTVGTAVVDGQRHLANYDLRFVCDTKKCFDRTYYLTLENSQGSEVAAFMLREKGAPKTPKNVSVMWMSHDEARLVWTPGFDGGKPQHFVIGSAEDNQITVPVLTVNMPPQGEAAQAILQQLEAGMAYNVCVRAVNIYGNSSCDYVTFTTLGEAASSASGGMVAGVIIAIIVIIFVVSLIIYVLVIRPRRNKEKDVDDDDYSTRKPMLPSQNEASPSSSPAVKYSKQPAAPASSPTDNGNNNQSTPVDEGEHLVTELQNPLDKVPHERPRNQDGLIYADLDLAKAGDPAVIHQREEHVNYDVIDFTRKPPLADPEQDPLELPSDEEELPSKC